MKKLKGFTLIELIVVLAIFSIILFAATSLMVPTEKIMNMFMVQENGNASATNMAAGLSNRLSAAECMHAYARVLNESEQEAAVREFKQAFYDGTLKAGSEPGVGVDYATGQVHVLTIDNTDGGRVRQRDYNVDFDPASTSVTLVQATFNDESTDIMNKALYDNYRFRFMLGGYSDTEEFNNAWVAMMPNVLSTWNSNVFMSSQYAELTMKVSQRYTCSCGNEIMLTEGNHLENADGTLGAVVTNCPSCGRRISRDNKAFVASASFPFVNLSHGFPTGMYYTIANRVVAAPTALDPSHTEIQQYVVDMSSNSVDTSIAQPSYWHVPRGARRIEDTTATMDGFTFVYTYGVDIDVE